MNITGVPCFIFNKKYAISGAQDLNILERMLGIATEGSLRSRDAAKVKEEKSILYQNINRCHHHVEYDLNSLCDKAGKPTEINSYLVNTKGKEEPSNKKQHAKGF